METARATIEPAPACRAYGALTRLQYSRHILRAYAQSATAYACSVHRARAQPRDSWGNATAARATSAATVPEASPQPSQAAPLDHRQPAYFFPLLPGTRRRNPRQSASYENNDLILLSLYRSPRA